MTVSEGEWFSSVGQMRKRLFDDKKSFNTGQNYSGKMSIDQNFFRAAKESITNRYPYGVIKHR